MAASVRNPAHEERELIGRIIFDALGEVGDGVLA